MIFYQESVAASAIQATGIAGFENGLRKDNQSSWKQPSGVSTIHEINAIIIFKGRVDQVPVGEDKSPTF